MMQNAPVVTGGFPKKREKKIKIKDSMYESRNIRNINKKYWHQKVEHLVNTCFKPTEERESAAIADVLPRKTYELVCEILNFPVASKLDKHHGVRLSAEQTMKTRYEYKSITMIIIERVLEVGNADFSLMVPAPEVVTPLDSVYNSVLEFEEPPNLTSNPKCASKHMRTKWKLPLLSRRTAMPIVRDVDSDTDVDVSPRDSEVEDSNPHYSFLQKSEREQVTWTSKYLPPEKEEEKSLIKRANDVTDRIAAEFCDYMKHLGGDQRSHLFTPEAIKELFQVEFDTHAARSLRVITKECHTVPDTVARYTKNMSRSRKEILEKLIEQDIGAQRRPRKITAFGRSLPRDQQWPAPPPAAQSSWRGTKRVPRDLTTLKAVWENILNLRSVKEYCKWVIEQPNIKRPPFLDEIGMFNIDNLNARLTLESHQVNLSENNVSCESSEGIPIDDLKKQLILCTEVKECNEEC